MSTDVLGAACRAFKRDLFGPMRSAIFQKSIFSQLAVPIFRFFLPFEHDTLLILFSSHYEAMHQHGYDFFGQTANRLRGLQSRQAVDIKHSEAVED